MFSEEDKIRMWNYRKQEIKMEIETDAPTTASYDRAVYTLKVAGNGRQFSTISVYGKKELWDLRELINEALASDENPQF